MTDTAKLFHNGRSQAVRLPSAYRFEGTEVYIRKDPDTGDVILSPRPPDWTGFFDALAGGEAPADFLDSAERAQDAQDRDPFADDSGA